MDSSSRRRRSSTDDKDRSKRHSHRKSSSSRRHSENKEKDAKEKRLSESSHRHKDNSSRRHSSRRSSSHSGHRRSSSSRHHDDKDRRSSRSSRHRLSSSHRTSSSRHNNAIHEPRIEEEEEEAIVPPPVLPAVVAASAQTRVGKEADTIQEGILMTTHAKEGMTILVENDHTASTKNDDDSLTLTHHDDYLTMTSTEGGPPELMGMPDNTHTTTFEKEEDPLQSSHRTNAITEDDNTTHQSETSRSRESYHSRDRSHQPASLLNINTPKSPSKSNRRSTRNNANSKAKKRSGSTRQSLILNTNAFLEQTNDVFLQKYTLGDVLYAGEFCQVLACTHKASGSQRAVKIIREIPGAGSHENWNAIHNGSGGTKCPEFEILRRIDTSFVPQIFKCYEHNGNHMIVMERCYGSNLRNELKRKSGGTLDEAAVKTIMKQLLTCLNYLHGTAHVVHCDVRPPNLLLDQPGDFSKIKLIDFDTAVMLKSDYKDSKEDGYIREKRGGGEGVYMVYHAPEVHKAKPKYDSKVDCWSCGVLMYRMLYNKLPFVEHEDDSEKDILKRMNAGDFRFPNREWMTVSDECKDIIKQLLSVKGKHRPSAEKALAHRWFQTGVGGTGSSEFREWNSEETMANMLGLSNMRKHNPNSRLKRAVCAFMGAEMLTKEEHAKAHSVFDKLDIVHDGVLNRHEVKAGFLLAFQMVLSEDELDDLFRRVDMDRNGSVDYTEFAVACMSEKELLTPDRLKRAFARFDQHKRGFISKQELRNLPAFAGYSEDLLEFVIAEVDLKGEGKIDYENFCKVMVTDALY